MKEFERDRDREPVDHKSIRIMRESEREKERERESHSTEQKVVYAATTFCDVPHVSPSLNGPVHDADDGGGVDAWNKHRLVLVGLPPYCLHSPSS